MRRAVTDGSLRVNAVSGTYVVILGMNTTKDAAVGLLGFAIHRRDNTENREGWLEGFKTFEETEPNPVAGKRYSTLKHPVQSYLWADYIAESEHSYTYKVVPLYGTPRDLIRGASVEVTIDTEAEDEGRHSIYFNRGVAGSQAYVDKFENKNPDEVDDRRAYIWLSRGLEEALIGFIKQANGPRYKLYASFYEFNYEPVLLAFREASDSGAGVKIIYDARQDNPRVANEEAIKKVGIEDLTIKRTEGKSYISHNKFIVLEKDGTPIEAWTGSTNITKGGIFGQSNVGHVVRDEGVAKAYYDYWTRLSKDPTCSDLRKANAESTPDPRGDLTQPTLFPLFSPRDSLEALKWYSERMDKAEETVCLTAAFGVNTLFANILSKDKDYLRYLLLETRGNNFKVYSKDPDTQIAEGQIIADDTLLRWAREKLTGFNQHVKYIHNKFMLIDPLSELPTVITGSANFSDASTKENDENMLVICGDKRVADIYLGEFFRLFNHFYFRHVVSNMESEDPEKKNIGYLKPDDSWAKKYFVPGSIKEKQRELFGGKMEQTI